MYARTVDGRTLTFGVSGKLVRNSLIMFDRETRSLWSHLTGGAIDGPLKGARLDVVAATQTSWGAWRRAYPDTTVMRHDYIGQSDGYAGYFGSGDAGILGRKRDDERLPVKSRVIGIRLVDKPKAYSLAAVAKARVVNDTFASASLAVFATGPESASVFSRVVDGRTLTFGVTGDDVTDRETGSTWDPVTGRAISGSLVGTALTAIPATTSFWFGWVDFFPGTDLFSG